MQSKILNPFTSMKAERGEEAAEEKFKASRGWWMRFKERSHLHCKSKRWSCKSWYIDAAANYSEYLAKIVSEGGYTTKQQIFNAFGRWNSFILNKISFKVFIAREEKSKCGFKASKDRLTLCLGTNTTGDFKLKAIAHLLFWKSCGS